jgi:GT2 family glycosyltransferase
MDAMKLSVVIPTYNRARVLGRTLLALERQTLAGEAFEVVVVDDGSDRVTREALRELTTAIRLRITEKEHGGLAAARNHGARQARGEFLLFLDDDIALQPQALHEHLGAHQAAGEPVVVVGSVRFPPGMEPSALLYYLEKSTYFDLFRDPDKYPQGRPPVLPVPGNASVPRRLFQDAGGYDESFVAYGGEDLELGERLSRRGVRFVYHPRAFGHHHHAKDFDRFCRDMEAAGEALIRLYRKYPGIRASKKIDVVEDSIFDLPGRKKLERLVLQMSLASPWLLDAVGHVLGRLQDRHALRHLLFPLFRWVGHYHYALGMRRGLGR